KVPGKKYRYDYSRITDHLYQVAESCIASAARSIEANTLGSTEERQSAGLKRRLARHSRQILVERLFNELAIVVIIIRHR
ncbi:MAG: hypothetical protein RLZ64_1169, partial [Pseudomonadota bacterium]